MASLSAEAPDPKTFKSWEDAFKYPIPAVRRMQQQLRGDINANRERLRTLVGTSYRDLLGTADSIVNMDIQMQEVEVHLSETSRRCNTTLLGKSNANAARLKVESQLLDRKRFLAASQLSVFRKCPEALARTLRKGGSVLLAAKILIISRLLHKQLAAAQGGSEYVDSIWSRLGRLRKKLLATVDHRLASSNLEAATLVDAMCGYSLATSTSSPLDILKYFHKIRQDAISSKLRSGATDHQSVLEALRLWIRTLQDTRAIFPKQLANALAKLRSGPLLKDDGITAISEFDFDIHAQWLGEEVRNFVPYIRRDDLSIGDASKQLSSWAPAALKTLLSNLKGCVGVVSSLAEIIELRKSCLELLFSHYHIAGVRRNGVLNGFRDAFEERLLEVVKQRCECLSEISGDISEILEEWNSHQDREMFPKLWDRSTTSMPIAHGAKDLKKALVTTVNGRTNTVQMVSDHYQKWLSSVEEVDKTIATMRNTRWEDHLDDLSDESDSESDEEHEATLSKVKILLKETDTASVRAALSSELAASYKKLQSTIDTLASSLDNDSSSQAKSAFLIRILREIKQRRPDDLTTLHIDFRCIPSLHSNIASPAVQVVVERHSKAISKALNRKQPPGRLMWDGTPELPVLPSPWSFRLLKDLEHELSIVGTDVWTPSARDEMKKLFRQQLVSSLQHAMKQCQSAKVANGEKEEDATTNGTHEGEDGEGTSEHLNGVANGDDHAASKAVELPTKESSIQYLFDIEFLGAFASVENVENIDEEFWSFQSWLREKADLDSEALKRIKASAEMYRKRTTLLFALAN